MFGKRIISLSVAAACWICSSAQRYPNDGMYRYSLDFTVTLAGIGTTAEEFVDSIDIIAEDGQIYVPVYIKGHRHLFNLDTGSSQGVFYAGERLQYNKVVGKVNSRDANGHIDTIPAVEFPDFYLGRLRISGYKGSLLRRPPGHYRYDGIIGFDLINRGLNAKIDIQARKLIITDRRDYFDNEPGHTLRYRLRRFVPYIALKPFGKHTEQFLIDLGSKDLLAINKAFFNRERQKDSNLNLFVEEETAGQRMIGSYGNERHGSIIYLRLPKIRWNDDFTFTDVHTATTQGDSRIGARLLNYGTLVFNPQRKSVTFQPYANVPELTPDMDTKDIYYVRAADGRAMVGSVRQNSLPYSRGFRQGDTILSINGTNIATLADLQGYPFVKGRRYVFRLRTPQGSNKEVVVEQWGF